MKMQQFNSKMISITQLRRDIDILENALEKNEEVTVIRNQDVLFVAFSPKKYQDIQQNYPVRARTKEEAIKDIDSLREKYGQTRKKNAGSNYVIRMREEAVKKWTK